MANLITFVVGVISGVIANFVYDWVRSHGSR